MTVAQLLKLTEHNSGQKRVILGRLLLTPLYRAWQMRGQVPKVRPFTGKDVLQRHVLTLELLRFILSFDQQWYFWRVNKRPRQMPCTSKSCKYYIKKKTKYFLLKGWFSKGTAVLIHYFQLFIN